MNNVEASDRSFRRWMRANLTRAAAHFGLVTMGAPRWGWRLRSIGIAAHGDRYGRCWLRAGSEHSHCIEEMGEFWTGNVDANVLTGVPKPRVLGHMEWDVPDQQRRVRAEVMTRLPGRPCSPTEVLHAPLRVPDLWWQSLRRSLDTVRAVPTDRFAHRGPVSRRAWEVLGVELRIDEWETVHGDLHWNNLLAPDLGLLDWEMWGRGPVGTDAATLYCCSLLVPETARRVRDTFADVLTGPAGRTAQLYTAARLLPRVERTFPDLAGALRRHVGTLIDRAAVSA